MTDREAQERVNTILNGLLRAGYLPPGQFTLRGGQLAARANPEFPADWRPVWEPLRPDLRPLDLEQFTPTAAVSQIARYSIDAYLPVRRHLETLLDAIQGEGFAPIENHGSPDSFFVYGGTLHIVEILQGSRRDPEYRIEFESNTLLQSLEPGEAPAESTRLDLTGKDVAESLRLLNAERPT